MSHSELASTIMLLVYNKIKAEGKGFEPESKFALWFERTDPSSQQRVSNANTSHNMKDLILIKG